MGPHRESGRHQAGAVTATMHFGDIVGIKHLEAGPGTAAVELRVQPQLCNRHGSVHGGVMMTLMDVAGLWAGAPGDGTPPRAATVSLTCNFLRAAPAGTEGVLRAEAEVVKRGRFLYFSTIRLLAGAEGALLASGQGIYSVPATP